ncbi:MAG: DUF11 domain-containing protein [Actinobacteria bacterium]|nr:MAG: DUF11 domain-containing protein [Actinomycetota bacterium]
MTSTVRVERAVPQRFLAVSAALAMFVSLIAVLAPPAGASIDLSIPIDTTIHAPVGSETLLATVETGDLEGLECSVSADATNQTSVHPGNDLVVASGSSSVVLEDVESVPGGTIEADGVLTLGSTVTVTLIMGEDHTFSAGITVLIDCEELPEDVSVSVTANECAVDEEGAPLGSVNVEITPDSGATVTLYSDAGMQNVVATFSGSGGSESLSPGTYYWDAEAAEGFQLTGETSGEFTIANCDGTVIVTSGDCTVTSEGEVPGFVQVNIDPDAAATVTVSDAGDNIVATFNTSGSADLDPGDYTWSAVPSDGFDLAGPTSGSFSVADCDDPEEPSTDVAVTKVDLVDPVIVDSDNTTAEITYEITVTNNGPVTAEDVVAVDTLPATVTYVSATTGTGTCSHAAGVVTCDLGDLSAGDSVTITVVVETEAVGEVTDPTVINVVQVSSSTNDDDPSNNSDDEQTDIVEVLAETVDPEVLPFTGDETGYMVAASLVLMTGGIAALQVARRREDG